MRDLVPGTVFVRPAQPDELPLLAAIEATGDAMFAELGMVLPAEYVTLEQLAAGDVMVIGAVAQDDPAVEPDVPAVSPAPAPPAAASPAPADPPSAAPASPAAVPSAGPDLLAPVPAVLVGFALIELPEPAAVDGERLAHLAQISVDARYGGRGLGRALLGGAVARAAARGAVVLTLTTFADVPWNAPFYRRCGFTEVPEERCPSYLRQHREAERAAGLDAIGPRVAMALPLR